MTEAHIAVSGKGGLSIPGSKVTIFDRTTGIMVGSAVADSDGVADISWLGTPFGGYRADAVTPKGWKGSVEFNLDWLANPGVVFIDIRESDEGSVSATAIAYWRSLGITGWILLGGGVLLGIYVLSRVLKDDQGQRIIVLPKLPKLSAGGTGRSG